MAADTKELFASLDKSVSEFLELLTSLSEKDINMIPFKNSWTAAQLISHVTKSNKAIAQALNMEGTAANRNAAERVQELKATFLDFTIKFQSPEFILPKPDIYQKEMLVTSFKNSIGRLKEGANKINLSEIISVPAFGEITKFELLHFVLYHTQRHLHQFKNIFKIIHNSGGFVADAGLVNN